MQWRAVHEQEPTDSDWQEFRPRPQRVTPLETLARLFWNPRWNETLYLVSLSERLTLEPTEHSEREIKTLLARHLRMVEPGIEQLQFRLVFVRREGGELIEEITHLSEPFAASGTAR